MKKILLMLIVTILSVRSFGQVPALLSSLGNVDVTSEANALAKVYVDDINKDIDIYFFDRFSQLLNNNPELRVLFPATVVYLDNVPNYQYTTMLSTLRTAFYKDLKKLPADIAAIAYMDTSTCCLNARNPTLCVEKIAHFECLFNTEEGRIISSALLIADGVINKTNMIAVLNNIATSPDIASATDTASNIIRLLNVFATSLTENGKWLTRDQWKAIAADNIERTAYLDSFVARTARASIKFGQIDISRYITDAPGLNGYINNLVNQGVILDSTFKLLRTDTAKGNRDKNVANLIAAFDQFFVYGTNYNAISDQIPPVPQRAKLIFYALNNSMEIAGDILTKNYQSAILTGALLLDSLMLTKTETTTRGKVKVKQRTVSKRLDGESAKKVRSLSHEQKANVLDTIATARRHPDSAFVAKVFTAQRTLTNNATADTNTSKYVDSTLKSYYRSKSDSKAVKKLIARETQAKMDFKQNFNKYGMLLATVVSADSSSQITAAIEAAAEPPGSSIVKKTTNFSIAVQGYGGLAGGFAGPSLNGSIHNFNSVNPYAPLGVSFSIGLKGHSSSDKFTAGSLSLFLSVIDIGSIVAYDFKNPTARSPDTVSVKLANIFAPGANLIYGIPNMPLSIGGGFQYLPMMQTISTDQSKQTTTSGCRWQVFAAFDLSFFNLYVSRK